MIEFVSPASHTHIHTNSEIRIQRYESKFKHSIKRFNFNVILTTILPPYPSIPRVFVSMTFEVFGSAHEETAIMAEEIRSISMIEISIIVQEKTTLILSREPGQIFSFAAGRSSKWNWGGLDGRYGRRLSLINRDKSKCDKSRVFCELREAGVLNFYKQRA